MLPFRRSLWLVLSVGALTLVAARHGVAATFFYTGSFGGDFFDESNRNSLPGGGGASPASGTIEPNIGFTHELILDGDSVTATGMGVGSDEFTLDVGASGTLTLLAGSDLQVTNNLFNSQFEVSTGATLNLIDATLGVDDDMFLRGTLNLTGGVIESFADDIELISSNVTVDGTTFTSDDSIIFRAEVTPSAGSQITGATFNAASRIGIREFNVTVTDTTFNVATDVEDVFVNDQDTATATLTLLGNSTLIADQVQQGVNLAIGGTSTATLTNVPDDDEPNWFTESSTGTLLTPDAQLILLNAHPEGAADRIFDGVTGLAYGDDASTWNPSNWNGSDAATLQITSIPSEDPDPDFNGDGDIDGADFLIWQRGVGLTGQMDNQTGDATGDGVVDGDDLASWQSAFGQTSAGASVGVVPEPTSCVLAAVAVVLVAARRRTSCRPAPH